MKLLFSLFIIALTLLCLSNKANLIPWQKDFKLIPEHYKGKINYQSKFDVLTSTSIRLTINREDSLKTSVTAYFNSSKSWIKNTATDALMQHEQIHFDITEIYACKLRDTIRKIKEMNLSVDKKKLLIEKCYKTITTQMKQEHNEYDLQTEHSLNTKKQKIWTDSISKQIKQLSQTH